MSNKLFKFVFLMVIPTALILFTFATYRYAQVQQLFADSNLQPIIYDQYQLQKTQYWKNRFDFMEQKYYNEVRRRIIGAKDNTLEVRRGEEKYVIYYQYQVDGDIIQTVTEVTEDGDQTSYKGRYFLVKYPKFLQLVYFNTANSKPDGGSEKVYEAEVCLELPVEINENVRYHIDEQSNIWIVTLSMNKVVFVQIYSCLEKRLIKQYRYTLKSEEFINSLYRIVKKSQSCMHIQVITYGVNRVDIELCPQNINNPLNEVAKHKTNELVYTQKQAKHWSSFTIVSQQTKQNQLWIILNNVLRVLNVNYQFKVVKQSEDKAVENVYEYFDTVSIDEKNNYLLTLSRNKTQTGIVTLDKFIINAKTPLFHGNPDYNPYGVLDLFDKQSKGIYDSEFTHRYLVPKLNQTKKISYKAAFPTVPNFKVQYIGFGDKALIFWPEHNLDQKDYLAIRTLNGALISQRTELKGIHEKLPLAADELTQRVDDKPQQVSPGIYEFHAVEQSLISKGTVYQRLQQYGKIELISLMNGKTVFTHNIRVKQGFRYVSSFLLNNEWWILQYNRDKKVSQAKKYEFYFMSSKPDKVYSLQMVYGNLTSQEYLNNEDQLSALMSKFVDEYKNGYLFVNVYRCVDEYYYIQYTDADFQVYGVARIHFKNLSNRRARKDKEYTQTFHKYVMLSEKDLAPYKYSLKPYAIAIDNMNVFKHLKYFLGEKGIVDQNWISFCKTNGENFRKLTKIDKYYYFPIQHYAMGNYGCNFNSDQIQNESILSLNMRNMIIQAKLQNRELLYIQKNVVYVLLSIIPTYFVLIGIVFAVMNKQGENDNVQKQKKEEDKKSAKEKKNN